MPPGTLIASLVQGRARADPFESGQLASRFPPSSCRAFRQSFAHADVATRRNSCHRTQEAAGSNPASSIGSACKRRCFVLVAAALRLAAFGWSTLGQLDVRRRRWASTSARSRAATPTRSWRHELSQRYGLDFRLTFKLLPTELPTQGGGDPGRPGNARLRRSGAGEDSRRAALLGRANRPNGGCRDAG